MKEQLTLAQQCEAIWPCGWTTHYSNIGERAVCRMLGHTWVVGRDAKSGYSWHGGPSFIEASNKLDELMRLAHNKVVEFAQIPALAYPPTPVHCQIRDVLEPMGWQRRDDLSTAWEFNDRPAGFAIILEPDNNTIQLQFFDNTWRKTTIGASTVKATLRNLLTFPLPPSLELSDYP
jgi:hypothetical protein